jgi:hypothetical protein
VSSQSSRSRAPVTPRRIAILDAICCRGWISKQTARRLSRAQERFLIYVDYWSMMFRRAIWVCNKQVEGTRPGYGDSEVWTVWLTVGRTYAEMTPDIGMTENTLKLRIWLLQSCLHNPGAVTWRWLPSSRRHTLHSARLRPTARNGPEDCDLKWSHQEPNSLEEVYLNVSIQGNSHCDSQLTARDHGIVYTSTGVSILYPFSSPLLVHNEPTYWAKSKAV